MLVVFEDEVWPRFTPLVYTRPLFELRCGAFTLYERIAAMLAAGQIELPPRAPLRTPKARISSRNSAPVTSDAPPLAGLSRPYLMPCFGPAGGVGGLLRDSSPVTLINGRALDLSWLPALLNEPLNTVYVADDQLLAAHLTPSLASVALYYLREQQASDALAELRRFGRIVELSSTMLAYPWDLIVQAGEQLVRDMPLLAARLPLYAANEPHIVTHNPQHIFVSPTAQLAGPLVLDARDGPIYIDQHAHIEPFSFIQGPAYIGVKALVSSALIRGETSIGPVCRVGGEVEASIIQGYSNKHHDGFLGHSWLGEWVNIGAMTTNSDLKNTYGSIKVLIEGLGQIDSGVLKLGCFLADHVKLGIGMHLTGGAVLGTGSSLFGIHMVPKNVPPFTWGSEVFYEYQIDRMIAVADKVMRRRKTELTPQQETVLRTVFGMTRANRGGLVQDVVQPGGTDERASLEQLARAETEAVHAYDYLPQAPL